MKSDMTEGGSQAEPNLTPMSTASMSGRQSLRKRFHIGQKARVGACGVPCLTQFCPDIAREILIPDFPEFRGGVEKNKALFLQVPLNDIGGASEKLFHAGKVHLAAFPKRYDKGILGAFRLLASVAGLSTRCRNTAAFLAEAGLACLPVLRATSGEMPLS